MSHPISEVRKPTEAQIQKAVIDHWRANSSPGSLVAAIPNMGAMGQYGLTKGLPDLMVMSKHIGVGFIELKRDAKSKVRPEQMAFKSLCVELGIPHSITYGRDEPVKVLEAWRAVKGKIEGKVE